MSSQWWKNYYNKNKIKISKYQKSYYKKNKKQILARNKKWALKNPLKIYKITKAHKNKYPLIWRFYNLKSRLKQRKIFLNFNREEFIIWYLKQKPFCCYCKVSEIEWKKSSDSLSKCFKTLQLDRIIPSKGYILSNLVLACPRCNLTKSDFFTFNQMKKIGKIVYESREHL